MLKEPRSKKITRWQNCTVQVQGSSWNRFPGYIEGKRRKGCNSETNAQIALKTKFGKEKGKIKFISFKRASEAIRAERRENGCNSETSAQIALKMKFGKEKVASKRKGK